MNAPFFAHPESRVNVDRPAPLPPDLADPLAIPRPAAWLAPLAGRVRYYPVVGSTNDVALRLAAEGAPDGTVVLADRQTAGRGRMGREWFSPPGAGLYMSILLRSSGGVAGDWPRRLTLGAGVALAEALLAATGLPVAIKWPNDLVITPGGGVRGARKLAGILAEGQGAGELDVVVLGCGINVGLAAYPAEIESRATSLEAELGRPVDRGLVLAVSLESLAREITRLRAGDVVPMLQRWRELAVGATGARVAWTEGGGPRTGVTAGIDSDGALIVRQDGLTRRLLAGEVRWL